MLKRFEIIPQFEKGVGLMERYFKGEVGLPGLDGNISFVIR
jgi:hypothetical protein